MKIDSTQTPGATNIYIDYLNQSGQIIDFYNGDFHSIDAYKELSANVRLVNRNRAALVSILHEQNQQFGCSNLTLDNINKLLNSNTCAVVTGQQVGLFSGPLYTIYKALNAIMLTDRLNRNCKGCYIPIFWLASEDHDIAEINHIHIIDKSNELQRLTLSGSNESNLPASEIELGKGINQIIQELIDHTYPSEFKDHVITVLKDCYRPDISYSEAFGKWITHLFKAFGLVIINPSDHRLKKLAGHIFKKEIEHHSPTTNRAKSVSNRLNDRDYHNQVQLHDGILNLFYAEKGRHAIHFSDDTYYLKTHDVNFIKKDLLELVQRNPEFFSPNVLLRPIYQDTLLPTVSYVAGPGELSYFGQMKDIYQFFELPMPIIYPRKSITILEGKIEKILSKYNLSLIESWKRKEDILNDIIRKHLPQDLENRLTETTKCIAHELDDIGVEVVKFDSTLSDVVSGAKGKVQHQMSLLEKKIIQSYKKSNDIITQHIDKLHNHVYPDNSLQERVLNVLPYLLKYGFGFIDRLYEAMDISNTDHQVLEL